MSAHPIRRAKPRRRTQPGPRGGAAEGPAPLELLERIAEGGMGVVWRGSLAGRAVAVKLLRDELAGDPAMQACMRQEARALERVAHPSVVRLVELRELGDPLLVLEWIEGRNLLDVIADRPTMTRIAHVYDQVLDGLAAVHAAGLVHGDVKSGNVMVDEARGDRAVLFDFGLAAPAGAPRAAGPGHPLCGTPEYMAPELLRGEAAHPTTDVYGAAVMLYELVAGEPPFSGTVDDVVAQQLGAPPPHLSSHRRGVPRELDELVAAALDKDPRARPRDAAELHARFRAALRHAPAAHLAAARARAPRITAGPTVPMPPRRK